MTIDASIYNNIRGPQIESPVNALAQVTQLRNAQNQNRLFDMKVAESEREQASQNALSDAYRKAYRADGSLDEQGLVSGLAQGGFGSKIPGIQKGLSDSKKAGYDAEKAKYESIIQNTDLVARTLAPALKNPALYPQLLAQLRQQTGGGQDMPEQFDPAIVQATIEKSLSTKDRAEQEFKQKGYDIDVAKFSETVRNNKTQNSISAGNLGVAQAGLGLRRQELDQKKTMDKETIKQNAASNAKVNDAKDVLGLLDEIDTILPKATNGLIGVARDTAAGGFGYSTEGANATAQLKALQGSLVSKMPKMTGPQSDKDVQLYREMAGQVGDPMVPRAQRQAASSTIRKLNEKYAGMEEGSSKKGASSSKIDSLLDKYK